MTKSAPLFKCCECQGKFTAKELNEATQRSFDIEHNTETVTIHPFDVDFYSTDAFYVCPLCHEEHYLDGYLEDAMARIVFAGFESISSNSEGLHLLKGDYFT